MNKVKRLIANVELKDSILHGRYERKSIKKSQIDDLTIIGKN